jgi:hypothetical protein
LNTFPLNAADLILSYPEFVDNHPARIGYAHFQVLGGHKQLKNPLTSGLHEVVLQLLVDHFDPLKIQGEPPLICETLPLNLHRP